MRIQQIKLPMLKVNVPNIFFRARRIPESITKPQICNSHGPYKRRICILKGCSLQKRSLKMWMFTPHGYQNSSAKAPIENENPSCPRQRIRNNCNFCRWSSFSIWVLRRIFDIDSQRRLERYSRVDPTSSYASARAPTSSAISALAPNVLVCLGFISLNMIVFRRGWRLRCLNSYVDSRCVLVRLATKISARRPNLPWIFESCYKDSRQHNMMRFVRALT